MRTHTWFVNFSKLAIQGEIGTLVVRVALAANDIATANSAMKYFRELQSPAMQHIKQGALLYFCRLQCGHLNEGMETIEGVRKTPQLQLFVGKCSGGAQQAYRELCACLNGESNHKEFKSRIGWVRNRVAFHYDPNDVRWAIEDRANPSTPSKQISSMTTGEDIHSTRFEFGDALLDSIVCRKFWEIPSSTDVQAEADRIGEWCFTKCVEYLKFAEEFVPVSLRGFGVTL